MTPSEHDRSTGQTTSHLQTIWPRISGYVGLAILLVAVAPFAGSVFSRIDLTALRFTGFDVGLWSRQSWVLQVHVLTAVGALLVGIAIFANGKGHALHRTLGWAWVMLMAVTAGSSLFITGLNGDAYSLIHILSGWTLIVLPLGILAIRRRDVTRHRKTMTSLFVGGLLIAGAVTFLPGRLMFRLFFDI